MTQLLTASNVDIYYGSKQAVKQVNLKVEKGSVNALIGPSGCGKTTFLRAINRMHDLTPGARVEGQILLDGQDIYSSGIDPVEVRRRVGMVFQKPNPFPTMSVFDNVVSGLKLAGMRDQKALMEIAERSLRGGALWDEVKDRLKSPATGLSGGQQQRLCIARALAVEPGNPADGRADLGARPGQHRQDRGPDDRTQKGHDHHHRDPQHAPGGPRQRHHQLLSQRRPR